jgi:hypothetical protein
MDLGVYKQTLEKYVLEAMQNSDGSAAGIANYLWNIKISGLLVRNRTEKQRALDDARQAFDEHRHWPVEIILSHLGIKPGTSKQA